MIALTLLLLGAPGDLALVGGKVITVSGAVIEGRTVLVSNGKITRVGKDLPAPAGFEVIDCANKWVTPGLIEASTRIGVVEIDAVADTVDSAASVPDPIRAAVRMDDAINPRSALIPVARRHGVTSVVVTPNGGLVAGRSAWLDLVDGDSPAWTHAFWGPLAMHAGLDASAAGMSGNSRAMSILRLRELFEDARLYARQGPAFERNALRKLTTSRLDLAAMADVLSKKMPLVIAAYRASDILRALELAKQEGLRMVITGGNEAWLVAAQLAAAKVPVILGPLDNDPGSFQTLNSRADNAALLAAAGVEVVLSTEQSHLASNLRFYAGNAVRAGMTFEAALRAITLAPALAFGAADRYGALEAGRVANLVVWSGDPFEPSTAAEVVVVKGQRTPVESRQTRLRARYQKRLGL